MNGAPNAVTGPAHRTATKADVAAAVAAHQALQEAPGASARDLRDHEHAVTAARLFYAATADGAAELRQQIDALQVIVEPMLPPTQPAGTAERPYVFPSHDYLRHPDFVALQTLKSNLRAAQQYRAASEAAAAAAAAVADGLIGPTLAAALDEEPQRTPTVQPVQDRGGHWRQGVHPQVGVVAVDQAHTVVDAAGQVAAWNTTHEVRPGTYPLYLDDTGSLVWTFNTVVVDEHRPSLFAGVPFAPGPKDAVGKPGTLYRHCYVFAAPQVYVPGVPFFGGQLVLRRGVHLTVQPAGRPDGRWSVPARLTVDDVERLPAVPYAR